MNEQQDLSESSLEKIAKLIKANNEVLFTHVDKAINANNEVLFTHVDNAIKANNTDLYASIDDRFVEFGKMVSNLEDRLVARIDAVDGKISSLEEKMDFRFTGIQNQLDNIYLNNVTRQEHGLLKERVRKCERKLGFS
jgi:hypothetical protein